jgi:hypothetical protein
MLWLRQMLSLILVQSILFLLQILDVILSWIMGASCDKNDHAASNICVLYLLPLQLTNSMCFW